jgi:uncharacterized membrane protein
MNAKTIGIIMAVVGVLVVLASLLADTLGIGNAPDAFGTNQIIGTVVGVVIVVVGAVVYFRTGQAKS